MIDSSLSPPPSKILSVHPSGRGASSSAIRGLRSVLTAVIALSLGIGLVSWLKAGDDTRPTEPSAIVTARAASGGALPRPGTSWAHARATQSR